MLGFCSGVRRAVEMAMRISAKPAYTLGPLIHNRSVLESLEERGFICLKDESVLPPPRENATVVIRAHGVSPAVEKKLLDRGLAVVDATCPNVKTSQKRAKDFSGSGYSVFLAGEENHAEIEGIRGYAQDAACFVVSNPQEAETAAKDLYRDEPSAKTVLIGQTTISEEEYHAVGEKIRQFFPALEIVNSICLATAERQDALRELSAGVEALIIVGSRESANTKRLLALARELGKPAYLAESPGDITPEMRKYKTVGLSAGASTPDSLIAEVEQSLLFV